MSNPQRTFQLSYETHRNPKVPLKWSQSTLKDTPTYYAITLKYPKVTFILLPMTPTITFKLTFEILLYTSMSNLVYLYNPSQSILNDSKYPKVPSECPVNFWLITIDKLFTVQDKWNFANLNFSLESYLKYINFFLSLHFAFHKNQKCNTQPLKMFAGRLFS